MSTFVFREWIMSSSQKELMATMRSIIAQAKGREFTAEESLQLAEASNEYANEVGRRQAIECSNMLREWVRYTAEEVDNGQPNCG